MILKASEETPGSAVFLCKILQEVGLPYGVVNLVFGVPSNISDYLFEKTEIKKVSFTGSVPVGKLLAAKAAKTLKRLTLELGGHSPAILAEDAKIKNTIDILSAFKFRNAGQVCIAPSRFFVHEKIYDEIADGFVKKAKQLKLGNGLESTTTMGPLSNIRRLEAMENFTNDALAKGANILSGGRRYGNSGYFWEPTIIENIPEAAEMLNTEIFGPIIPLIKYSVIDEAINMLKRAYKQKKNDPYIIDSIGWAYYLIGDYIEAENYLIQAVQLMPDDPIVNDHYGDILWKLDRKLQAKYFWENVLQLNSTEEKMKKNILEKLINGPDKI